MTQWIEVSDITSRWRDGSPPLTSLITTQINDIEDFLLVNGGTNSIIQDRIDAGTITAGTVKRILSTAVIRALQSPQNDRINSWSESAAGTFSQSQSLTGPNRSGVLLTEAELFSLMGKRSGRAKIGAIYIMGGPSLGYDTWI